MSEPVLSKTMENRNWEGGESDNFRQTRGYGSQGEGWAYNDSGNTQQKEKKTEHHDRKKKTRDKRRDVRSGRSGGGGDIL